MLAILICLVSVFVGGFAQCLTVGVLNNVICVSKTQFVLGFQDPNIATPLSCPANTVCADVTEICSLTASPACTNTVPGTKNRCNDCTNAVAGSPVCINSTAYSLCINGAVSKTLIQSCMAPEPYCRIVTGVSTCTAASTVLDCPSSGSGRASRTGSGTISASGSRSGSTSFTCVVAGFFSDPTDSTCMRYFKCQKNAKGGLDQLSYTCQVPHYAFNPTKSLCVPRTSFNCPNQ